MTGDATWKKVGNGIVDRMNRLVIRDGKVAFFPKFNWLPGEMLPDAELKKIAERWREQIKADQTSRGLEENGRREQHEHCPLADVDHRRPGAVLHGHEI